MPITKIWKIHPMLVEKVRLNGNKIDEKNGAWCQVTWFSDGTYEIESMNFCGIRAMGNRIPFNPMNHDAFEEYGWGDERRQGDDKFEE